MMVQLSIRELNQMDTEYQIWLASSTRSALQYLVK